MAPDDDPKARVREWFTKHAASYTTNRSQRAGPDLRRLLELLALTGDETVLDVACGPGHTALAVARFARHVVGVDLTPAMGDQFAKNAAEAGVANAEFHVGDADHLPFADASFDVVTCRRAVHHFPDPPRAAAEIARVLRPGGRAGLVDMVAPEDTAAARLFNDLERARDSGHVRALAPSEFRRVFEAAGLRVEAFEPQPDRMTWAAWLAPEPADGAAEAAARAVLASASAAARALVVDDGPDGRHFLKTRLVAVAKR